MCGRRSASGRRRAGLPRTPWMPSARAAISRKSSASAASGTGRWCRAMPRYAFQLRIKADCIEEYDREHQRVWPELLAKLKAVGISDYSIFRRGQDLTLVLRVNDFDRAWDELDK